MKPKKLPKPRWSAKQLGLTKESYNALIWTRQQLAKEALKPIDLNERVSRGNRFDMETQVWAITRPDREGIKNYNCGTVACIGGWMAIHALGYKPRASGTYILKDKQYIKASTLMERWATQNTQLNTLFYNFRGNWADLTFVVWVIDNYLTTGRVHWAYGSIPAGFSEYEHGQR
jgi:hypothetical protein